MKRGPTAGRYVNIWDRLFPRRHESWWQNRTAGLAEQFTDEQLGAAKAAFEHAQAVADTARERADAADRRATTITGTVAIAASFTLGGAGVVLDGGKFRGHGDLRAEFAALLTLTTIAFVASGAYALTALVWTRKWNWVKPDDLEAVKGTSEAGRYGARAAQLIADFPFNWEVSVQKNHLVDKALWALVMALVGIAGLAALVFASVA